MSTIYLTNFFFFVVHRVNMNVHLLLYKHLIIQCYYLAIVVDGRRRLIKFSSYQVSEPPCNTMNLFKTEVDDPKVSVFKHLLTIIRAHKHLRQVGVDFDINRALIFFSFK